uniref:60S ribosomal protein L34 n=1 Tax=Chromera velia CCMP2878 TaxID=1169474 RepID=A0A0G4I359_9ALVE|mmetsp:Transcript_6969/g.13698  ORF Transcript_6969/g.13698 Transcript_6969/m.13698 type:complete len:132 (-) Transcript_6969:397-792(-)|eukprot:Cvel_1734.t1-p1 / transcript=Cvel_1734.t1 / gene=Cvel_1734 / organism=Chromera_velia_CCMP2878 / gene_product=60S ribosomal protein L34, putative / transcript_product=60S ribosomal protein L34, putative / location=Cvel_scaffold63:53720-54348(-) / protein_length=131 / sequence_SO=supercontig / SO=protein_coding / is_pseudo=false
MVQRLTYRRKNRYNTASNQQKIVRTPGGRLVYQLAKKKANAPSCRDCESTLHGIPVLRAHEYKNIAKTHRTVRRAYGGNLCPGCLRQRIVRAFLLDEQKCVKEVLIEKEKQAKKETEGTKTKSKKKSKKSS